jgi:hypothetical protein
MLFNNILLYKLNQKRKAADKYQLPLYLYAILFIFLILANHEFHQAILLVPVVVLVLALDLLF